METFGERLTYLRSRKQKNIKDLAAGIGISIQAWTDYEKNRSMPQVEKLIAISKYFNVTVDYLLFGNIQLKSPEITNYYDSYIECLIELLSSGLLKIVQNNNLFSDVIFTSDDEIINIYMLEYKRVINNNKSLLSKEEMKELMKIISKRFSKYTLVK